MHTNSTVLAAIISSTLLSGTLAGAQNDGTRLPRATVHVEAVGPFGSEIEPSHVHLRLLTKERKLAVEGNGAKLVDVPYGAYVLSAWDNGGSYGEREITLNTKELWVRIGLAFPLGDRLWPGGDLTISGSIRPAPPVGKEWWVRIDGVFLHATKEGPVLQDGRFSIGGLEMGRYLVEVFDGPVLLYVDTIEIDPNARERHMNISISSVKPYIQKAK